MTTREQDAVIERIANEYGATRVQPLEILGERIPAVAVCAYEDDTLGERLRISPWYIVAEDGSETVLLDTEES